MEQPWLRNGFRIPNLRGYVSQHRPQIVHAILTIIQAWVAEGQPKHGNLLGSFESWSGVIGGILDVAQVPGFLGNLGAMYEEADAEGQMWREFVEAWWEAFGETPKKPSELNKHCHERDLMLAGRGSGAAQSQMTKLGLALDGAKERIFG